MKSVKFNVLARAVYSPGVDVSHISALSPRQGESLHYKEASKILGCKGLRYKDEATLMALVVSKYILDQAPDLDEQERMQTAVIVTSNLGNLDTVVENAKIIAQEHVDATSAMALPNASSNVVSASIAIFNQLRGPNLMLCNGDQSGLDALQLAQDLMLAKRATRVLVVGVEVDNPIVQSLIPSNTTRFHGAAGYLIEQEDTSKPRDLTEIKATLQTIQEAENLLDDSEVTQFAGDASAVTGVMQVLLAMECAEEKQPRTLNKNRSSWRVAC